MSDRALVTSKIMAEAWQRLADEILPLTITPQQAEWARRFFYAGAKTVLDNLLYSDTLDETSDEATPQDINRVDALFHEINEFFCRIGELQ
jgi:hypothetical protein